MKGSELAYHGNLAPAAVGAKVLPAPAARISAACPPCLSEEE